MKVKEVLKKFIPIRCNCDIFVQDGLFGDLIELTKDDIKNLTPDFVMNKTINCLTVTDNVFTLHVDFNK